MHRLVPDFILHHYAQGLTQGSFAAAGVFVDISGFSAMTDVLMSHGQHGAEVLAGVMRAAFDPLIQAVYEQGGFVVTQAGDSFTALFPLGDEPVLGMRRALAAVWGVCQAAGAHPVYVTPYGEFTLSIKAGLAAGEAFWGIIASVDNQRAAYYFRGTALDGCTEAEHHAQPGEVILVETIYTALQDRVTVTPSDGYYRLEHVSGELPAAQPVTLPESDLALATCFFPKNLLEQMHRGEFRQVTYLFISLPTVRTDAQLAIFMQSVFSLQNDYGGLLKLQFGDKGVHLLLIWGAPLAHENDVQRAISFALDLQARTTIPIVGGITHRIAHAGYIGSSLAEEYTAYGRGINLAARFMTNAARGEIWLDEYVAQRAQPLVEVEYLGEKLFKGFAQPQKVYLLLECKESGETFFDGVLVGRETEIGELYHFVRPVFQSQYAGALVVWGEPGMGKSRLVHEFLARLKQDLSYNAGQRTSFQVFLAQTDEILRQPLNPFRYWLKHYFGVSDEFADVKNKRSFNRKLDELISATDSLHLAEELDRTRSFLGALVGLHWPDSLYEQLEGEARRENIFAGLVCLLRAESLQKPVIFFLEDIHWLDDASQAFLPRMLRSLAADLHSYPIAVLATSRRLGRRARLDGLDTAQIDLDRLPRQALAQLAEAQLEGPLDESVLNLLEARSEGNPFFAGQVLHYLQDENLLVQKEHGWAISAQVGLALPVDVRAVLVARLDRLAQEVKEVVQTAAVLGREFEVRLLAQMLRDDQHLGDKIIQAEQAAVWAALSEMHYLFRHTLLRDAAYTMQLRARRQELHALAVQAIEKIYAGHLEEQYADLAYHAGQAGWVDKALHYLPLAGRAAQDAYQNTQAIDYYSRALDLTPATEIEARFDLLLARDTVYDILGMRQERIQDLQSLESLVQNGIDAGRRAAWALRQADYAADEGEFDRAVELVQQALVNAAAAGQQDTVLKAYVYGSSYYLHYNQLPAAIAYSEKGLELARQAGDWFKEAQLLNNLGMVAMEQRELAVARNHFETSLRIARQAGSLRAQALPLNNLGLVTGYQGDFALALEYYEQSLAISRQIGIRAGQGIVLGNLGWVAGALGEYSKALDYTRQQLSIAQEVGDRYSETYAQINYSAYAGALGDHAASLQAAELGLQLALKIGECMAEAWALTYLGHSHFGLGHLADAAQAYQSALDIRQAQDQLLLATEPAAGLARVALETGDLVVAQKHLAFVLEYLEGGGSLNGTDEPLRVYLTCYLVLRASGDPRAGKILDAAYALLQDRAARIKAESSRQAFLENVICHRAICEAWQSRQAN